MSLKDEIREKLGKTPKKVDITPYLTQVRTIVKKIEMSPEIKDIFRNIDENINKSWGIDNTYFEKHGRPKYKNLWQDWTRFKEWIEREILT